jgi:hypothetical protein
MKLLTPFILVLLMQGCGGGNTPDTDGVTTTDFDYIDYFGGKQNSHGNLFTNGKIVSWWRINSLSANSMSICWKDSTTEYFHWDDEKIYQTGWKDQYEYKIETTKTVLTENGISTIISTSGPQIYAFRRKNNAYTLETEGIIYQLGSMISIPYRHFQFYGQVYTKNNGFMNNRQVVPMREVWEDTNNSSNVMTLTLDRTITYALNIGPAYTIEQVFPYAWSSAISSIGDANEHPCRY